MMPNKETLLAMESMLDVASDYTRLRILYCLKEREKCVSEIHQELGISQSLVSHQLRVLKDAKLVACRKCKTQVIYRLDDLHIHALLQVVHEHVSEE